MIKDRIKGGSLQELTYQELEKMNDDEWILINSNVVYSLLAYYHGHQLDSEERKNLEVLTQYSEDINVIGFGAHRNEEGAFFYHIPVGVAKIVLSPWKNKERILSRPYVIFRDLEQKIPFPPSKLPELRIKYHAFLVEQRKKIDQEEEKRSSGIVKPWEINKKYQKKKTLY